MKTVDARNYILNRNRKAGYYGNQKIVNCGLCGELNKYWIELADGQIVTLTRTDPILTCSPSVSNLYTAEILRKGEKI